jgi:ankyrin repeat protein
VAAEVGSLASLRLLLEAQPPGDVNAVNKAGRTVLHVAVERGDIDMVDYLIKHRDIDIDLKDKKGKCTHNICQKTV